MKNLISGQKFSLLTLWTVCKYTFVSVLITLSKKLSKLKILAINFDIFHVNQKILAITTWFKKVYGFIIVLISNNGK